MRHLVVALAALVSVAYGHWVKKEGGGFNCFLGSARCTLQKQLGKGGFGEAWLTRVVFKGSEEEIDRFLQQEEWLRQRIEGKEQREITVVAKFAHQHGGIADNLKEISEWARLPPHESIADLIHFDLIQSKKHGTEIVLFVEYVEDSMPLEKALQTNFADFLKNGQKMDSELLMSITKQILAALAHAHKYGLVHSDPSPDNIIIDRNFKVRLIDFGCATAGNPVMGFSDMPPTKWLFAPCEHPHKFTMGNKIGEIRLKQGLERLNDLHMGSGVMITKSDVPYVVSVLSPYLSGLSSMCISGALGKKSTRGLELFPNLARAYDLFPTCEGIDAYEVAISILLLWLGESFNTTVEDLVELFKSSGAPLRHSDSVGLWLVDTCLLDTMKNTRPEPRETPQSLLDKVAKRLAQKKRPAIPQALREQLEAMLSPNWRFRQTSMKKVLRSISPHEKKRGSFYHAWVSRSRTMLNLLKTPGISPKVADDIAYQAYANAYRAASTAETSQQFQSACDLRVEALQNFTGHGRARLWVPICAYMPGQCAKRAPLHLMLWLTVLLLVVHVLIVNPTSLQTTWCTVCFIEVAFVAASHLLYGTDFTSFDFGCASFLSALYIPFVAKAASGQPFRLLSLLLVGYAGFCFLTVVVGVLLWENVVLLTIALAIAWEWTKKRLFV